MAILLSCALLFAPAAQALAPAQARAAGSSAAEPVVDASQSEMRAWIERYGVDRGNLNRSYPIVFSPARQERFKKFYAEWLERLGRQNFDAMGAEGRADYVLFRNHLEYEMRRLDFQARQFAEAEPLIPFARTLIGLEESRRWMQPIEPSRTAALLNELKKQIAETQKRVEAGVRPPGRGEGRGEPRAEAAAEKIEPLKAKKTVVNRAVAITNSLRGTFRNWFGFYNAYDPLFTWWVTEPYREADAALGAYATFLGERVLGVRLESAADPGRGGPGGGPGGGAGQRQAQGTPRVGTARPGDTSDIIGDPIGREALLQELESEMIPYTPEELIALAKKELAWCEAEMVKASRALGYGDDWKKALEHVKTRHVEPGKQPELIRMLALEAIQFVEERDLLTVPPLARDAWRMEMMSPERQLVNPFFLGGEVIQVSFPTSTMSHEQKMMSMRGNNIHFARATVHHELIPGHHLQGFMTARYKPYRGLFSTPFWGEGWALYWELLLWDLNFAKSPENRIGMLFWRMHRCARIIFSLSFHLEQMTPQECIDFLVERVGHERENATGEVRRSFGDAYGPLYQAAYLLGGLQLYALHKELVGSGKMTNRAFHDAILKENRIPIEMVRAILTKQRLARDFKTTWKFYGPNPGN
jgi:hypothetical protein